MLGDRGYQRVSGVVFGPVRVFVRWVRCRFPRLVGVGNRRRAVRRRREICERVTDGDDGYGSGGEKREF